MLTLLSLLQSRRDWPGQVLAERLDVTVRTVRRDVDRLRELGYSIAAVKGPDGGYRLAPGTELPPLLFDDEQAVAIAVALQSTPSSGVDLDEAAARALTTVKQVMPSRLRHLVEGFQFTDTGGSTRVDPAVLGEVSAATRDHRILRFGYGENGGEDWSVPPKRVEPYAVIAVRGRWYLVAWDLDKADWRIYRLDRMTPKPPAGAAFMPRTIPGGSAGVFLSSRLKGSDRGDVWPCRGELLLQLPASRIAPWLGDGELEQVSATACRVRVGSWSWAGVLSWAVRFDAPFTVLGPDPFIDAMAGFAGRISAATGAPAD